MLLTSAGTYTHVHPCTDTRLHVVKNKTSLFKKLKDAKCEAQVGGCKGLDKDKRSVGSLLRSYDFAAYPGRGSLAHCISLCCVI